MMPLCGYPRHVVHPFSIPSPHLRNKATVNAQHGTVDE
jgi:hypothetical protein